MQKLLSRSKHKKFESNSALHNKDQKKRGVENTKEMEHNKNFAGLRNFRNLRNFRTVAKLLLTTATVHQFSIVHP